MFFDYLFLLTKFHNSYCLKFGKGDVKLKRFCNKREANPRRGRRIINLLNNE